MLMIAADSLYFPPIHQSVSFNMENGCEFKIRKPFYPVYNITSFNSKRNDTVSRTSTMTITVELFRFNEISILIIVRRHLLVRD